MIKDAGHHIHADQPTMFNETVSTICRMSDEEIYNKNIILNEIIDNQNTAIRSSVNEFAKIEELNNVISIDIVNTI